MSSFNDTVGLERALLKQVTNSLAVARLYLPQIKPSYFTSPYRAFIYEMAVETLRQTASVLTETVFQYEVGTRFSDASKKAYYVSEWELVQGNVAKDNPELLIAKLQEAELGRATLKISEDVVRMLTKGNISEAVSYIKRASMTLANKAETRPIVEINDISRRKQTIADKKRDPGKYLGIKTGFANIDFRTGGLFPGELTLIAGLTGVGKSTLVKQLCTNIVMNNPGKNVLHIANEEYLEQVEHKYDANLTGIPYLDFKRATISESDLARWEEFMSKWQYGRIFIKEVPAFTDVSLVEQAFVELENRGIPIHCIVIDHLPHIKPIQQAYDPNDERAKAASDCKEIARNLRVPVVVPTQAATDVEAKQMKGHRAGALDVYGSKAQIHVANTFMIITVQGFDNTQKATVPEEKRDVFWLIDVKKARDGPKFCFRVRHRVLVGRIDETERFDPDELKAFDGAIADSDNSGESHVQIPVDSADEEAVLPQLSSAIEEAEQTEQVTSIDTSQIQSELTEEAPVSLLEKLKKLKTV